MPGSPAAAAAAAEPHSEPRDKATSGAPTNLLLNPLKHRHDEENTDHKFRPPPPPVDNNNESMDISHASCGSEIEPEPPASAVDGHRLPAPIDATVATPAFPAPGADGKTELDFIPVPPDFKRIRVHLPTLRAPETSTSPKTQADWAQARADKPHCVYIIPFCMSYRPETAGDYLDNLTAVLRRNLTSSPDLEVLPPKPAISRPTPYAYPWAFLATGLQPEDAKMLAYYQIWFTKETQFIAFDTAVQNSDFIGCF